MLATLLSPAIPRNAPMAENNTTIIWLSNKISAIIPKIEPANEARRNNIQKSTALNCSFLSLAIFN